jgi:putative SOS response-associated peptidase YedK
MCNRFALPVSPEEIASHFELPSLEAFPPRYNVAPGEGIFVVRQDEGARVLDVSSWGLRPSFTRGPGKPLMNVRAETLRGKPGSAPLAREGRCLVPAGGFFEWRRVGRARQPWYCRLTDSPLLGLAAVSELVPEEGADSPARHCAIVTTQPNALVAEVHDRMPVIIPREHYAAWLDPRIDLRDIVSLLEPFPAERMTAYPVSSQVNRAGFEDPSAIEPSPRETLF